MKHLARMLAWNYLTFKGKDKSISFMIKICFLGIFIGTFALMMTLIITNGFEKTIHEKMQGINAQAVMYSPGNRLDYHALATILEKEFSSFLRGISGHTIKQAILERDKTQTVIFLKGIDPLNETRVTNLSSKIVSPLPHKTPELSNLLQEKNIIIGHKMAQQLKLSIGDSLSLLIPEAGGRKHINLRKETVSVAGIFDIGLEEYDNNFAFTSLTYLNHLFEEEGVDAIALSFQQTSPLSITQLWHQHHNKLSFSFLKACSVTLARKIKYVFIRPTSEDDIIRYLQNRFSTLTVQSWKEQYPALVSSLKLEKYVMFFIIGLITLVAAMNMISLLFMQVQQKRRDIAIYRAMGMSNKKVQAIFLRLGLIITTSASLSGLICAGILGYLLECYPFIKLPDVYYVSYLPARVDIELFIIVFFTTMVIGFIATWLPAKRSKYINIAHVLRHE